MKSTLFSALLILAALPAIAQDYAPVRAGDTAYFEDYEGNLQAIAITEVKTDGADTILVPFHQIREKNDCYNPYGEHWLGEIVKKPGGEFLFIATDIWDDIDTLRIMSNAKKGDSWVFRREFRTADTAYVVEETTKTFLGVTDSVKVIQFNRGAQLSELWLSKNYGFIKLPVIADWANSFNIFTWPDPYYIDLYLVDFIGHSRINPDILRINFDMIFDILPGHEFHIISFGYYTVWNQTGDSMVTFSTTTKEIRKCINKVSSPDTIWITWKRRTEFIEDSYNRPYIHKVWEDTIEEKVANAPMFSALPGQTTCTGNSGGNIFMPEKEFPFNRTVKVPIHYSHLAIGGSWPHPDTCLSLAHIDGNCLHENEYYYEGLGGPYYSCYDRFAQNGRVLAYYKKDTVTKGTPLQIWMTGEKEPEKSLQITVFPNPATEKIHIALKGAGSAGVEQVQLLNLQGQVLYTRQEKSSQSAEIDVSGLAAGVYLLRISSDDRMGFKKIVVVR